MAEEFSVKIEGLRELGKILDEYEPKLRRKILTAALRKSAKEIAADARNFLLGKAKLRTGHLYNSIAVRTIKKRYNPAGAIVVVRSIDESLSRYYMGKKQGKKRLPAHVYGRFLEFGVPQLKRNFSFLNPAASSAAQKAVSIFESEVKRKIDNV